MFPNFIPGKMPRRHKVYALFQDRIKRRGERQVAGWGCGAVRGSAMDNLGEISSFCVPGPEVRGAALSRRRVSWITGTPPPVIKVQHERRRNHVKMILPVISLSSSLLIPLFITLACIIHFPLLSRSSSSHTPSPAVVWGKNNHGLAVDRYWALI